MWNLVWPVFWLIVIFIIIGYCGNQIKSILAAFADKRPKKLGFMGVNIELGTNQDLPIGSQQSEAKQQYYTKAFQSILITQEENIIKEQLTSAGFTQEQAINTLIYQLANKNWIVAFSFIDKSIYQEQINVLSYLNSQSKSSTELELMPFYEKRKKQANNNDEYSYKDFLGFLLHHQLITQQIDGYKISFLGKEYLSFLIKIGRPIL